MKKTTINIITIILTIIALSLMIYQVVSKHNDTKKCINKYESKTEIIEKCF